MPKQITACTGEDWDWVTATSSPHPDASCSRSHLLSEKGVLLLPRPSSLNAHATLTRSVPAGRQCHHSAASSSARLNTGAKVQTAAGLGEVHTHTRMQEYTLGRRKKKKNHRLHRMYMLTSLTLNHSVSLSHTETSRSKAAAKDQRSRGHRAELVPRWWLVRWRNSNFINPEVNSLWTGCLCSPPTSLIHTHALSAVAKNETCASPDSSRQHVFSHTTCFWPPTPHLRTLSDNLTCQRCGNC